MFFLSKFLKFPIIEKELFFGRIINCNEAEHSSDDANVFLDSFYVSNESIIWK